MGDFFVGLALGQPTALAVVERQDVTPTVYHVRHLHRFSSDKSYPAIIQHVQELMHKKPLMQTETVVDALGEETIENLSPLIADATGVGEPIVKLLRLAELEPVVVTITTMDSVSHDRWNYRVPKRDLVSVLQVLLQTGCLEIAEALPDAATLATGLRAFRVEITIDTEDAYHAWREGTHDDLVFSVALAVWYGECGQTSSVGFDESEDEEEGRPEDAELTALSGRGTPRGLMGLPKIGGIGEG